MDFETTLPVSQPAQEAFEAVKKTANWVGTLDTADADSKSVWLSTSHGGRRVAMVVSCSKDAEHRDRCTLLIGANGDGWDEPTVRAVNRFVKTYERVAANAPRETIIGASDTEPDGWPDNPVLTNAFIAFLIAVFATLIVLLCYKAFLK